MENKNGWEGLLFDIVSSTKEGIAKGVDFAIQQSPDLVNQLLRWQMIMNSVWAGFNLLVFIALSRVEYSVITYPIESDGRTILMSLLAVGIIFFFGVTVRYALEVVKIIAAPKLFLVEYLYDKVQDNTDSN